MSDTPRAEEFNALHTRAAVFDLTHRGRIWIGGKHWERFLHGMITADIKAVPEGSAAATSLADATGGYLAHGTLLRHGDGVLFDVHEDREDAVIETLKRYVLALRVDIASRRADVGLLSVQGPEALPRLAAALEVDLASLDAPPPQAIRVAFADEEAWVVQQPRSGEVGLDVFASPGALAILREKLLAAGATAGSAETLEAARIEAGLPDSARDLDDRVMPIEAPLRHGISLTKGCFNGYEALAKLVYRGEPRRLLLGVRYADGAAAPAVGTPITADGKKAGWVTTSVTHPTDGALIGLAWVKRRYAVAGTTIATKPEGDEPSVQGELATLPLAWGTATPFEIPQY